MSSEMLVAVLSLCGTVIGSLAGILTANKLTNYRLTKLEEQINQINKLEDRTVNLETETRLQESFIETLQTNIRTILSDLKEIRKNGSI